MKLLVSELRLRRTSLIVWVVSVLALVAMIIAFYPQIRSGPSLNSVYANMSPAMQALLGGSNLTSPAGYLNTQVFAFFLPAVLLVFGRCLRAFPGEVEDAVTITQFRTLVVLEGHGDTRLNQLAERLGVTPSTALRMVDRLIAADLVTREENKADRREVLIGLTHAGARLVREVTQRRRAEIAAIVAAMPQEGREKVVAALDAFAQAAGEAAPSVDSAARLGW